MHRYRQQHRVLVLMAGLSSLLIQHITYVPIPRHRNHLCMHVYDNLVQCVCVRDSWSRDVTLMVDWGTLIQGGLSRTPPMALGVNCKSHHCNNNQCVTGWWWKGRWCWLATVWSSHGFFKMLFLSFVYEFLRFLVSVLHHTTAPRWPSEEDGGYCWKHVKARNNISK